MRLLPDRDPEKNGIGGRSRRYRRDGRSADVGHTDHSSLIETVLRRRKFEDGRMDGREVGRIELVEHVTGSGAVSGRDEGRGSRQRWRRSGYQSRAGQRGRGRREDGKTRRQDDRSPGRSRGPHQRRHCDLRGGHHRHWRRCRNSKRSPTCRLQWSTEMQ